MSAAVAGVPTGLFVGGRFCGAHDGATFAVRDPATEEVLAEVADASPADGERALAAAHGSFAAWRDTAPRERSALLRRAYDLTLERADELAEVMCLEMGKPLAQCRGEMVYAADFWLWYSEEAVRGDGRIAHAPDGSARVLAYPQPVGPCVLITPWNFPAAMVARKLAPALAAGCTAVLKPAEETPLSALALAQVLEDAGLPDGVVSVLPTSRPAELVEPLLADARTRKVSFTGSTEVGKILMRQAADNVLKISLELGGNAPLLVFADADLEQAVEGAAFAKLRNVGEACTAANRMLVEDSIAEEFTERLAARLASAPVGHGMDPATEIGPLISSEAVDKAQRIVDDALERGARPALQGGRRDGPGHFFAPVVLADVPGDAAPLHEEVFAPVAPVVSFSSEDEAVALANDTRYGLVAYLYARDIDRALRVADRLETGMVGLNQPLVSNVGAPFGGVKESGLGREGGPEGLAEFQELKYVAIRRGDSAA